MDLKKLSVVLLIASGGMLAFILYVQPKLFSPKDEPATQPAATQPAITPTPPVAATQPAAPPAVATQPAPEPPAVVQPPAPRPTTKAAGKLVQLFASEAPAGQKYVIGSTDQRTGYLAAIEVISDGAAVNTIKLSRHFATVADKHRWRDDPDTYPAACLEDPKTYQGPYSMLNPVAQGGRLYRPMATRTIYIGRREGADDKTSWYYGNLADLPWTLDARAEDSISLSCTLYLGTSWADAKGKPVVKLVKSYRVAKDDYAVDMSLQIVSLTDEPVSVRLDQGGPTGLPREDIRSDARSTVCGKLTPESQDVQPMPRGASELTKTTDGKARYPLGENVYVGSVADETPALWIAHVNKFFGSVMYVVPKEDRLEAAAWGGEFYVMGAMENAESRTYVTGVRFPDLQFKAKQSRQINFQIYAGPKKRSIFVDDNDPYHKPLYEKLNYAGTIDLGGCFCAWDALTLGMMWLLQKLALVAFGNFGLGIILLVVLVRLAMHPLTKKGQVAAAKMQKLGPEMQRLKEKYADDKETLNKEMMRFYKTQGATPLLGCLPMLIQMPIWIALWTSINATVELRHAALLPVWITDLAAPDAVLTWANELPLIGTQFNLLPLLLTVAMIFQMKLSPSMAQPGAGGATDQQKQQKMMMYMMPGMMLFIFYNAPSGLTLYIMTSMSASVAEQYIIRKQLRAKEAAQAAQETTVMLPGKASRSSRPKKPKGPNWVKRG